MTFRIYILLSLFLLVFVSSCYEDKLVVDDTDLLNKSHPAIDVNGDIVGFVQDEFGNKLSGYNIKMLDGIYNSDFTAYYHFKAIKANKNGTLIQLNKDQNNYQFMVKPIENEVCYFKHTIITKPTIHNESSDKSIVLNENEGFRLEIEKDAFRLRNDKYEGEVKISLFEHNLQNPVHLESLPGDHLAFDKDSNDVWLDIYNSFYIKLQSQDGDVLSIEKEKAKVFIKSNECVGCLVWKYNNKNYYWEEYSTIDNNSFSINKPGFYCLANPNIYNLVEGQLNVNGIPLINSPIEIYSDGRLLERVFTTNSGKWVTHLPVNGEYEYKVKLGCDKSIEESFNIEEKDLKMLIKNFEKDNISSVNIKGEVRDCSNQLENNSFLKLQQNEIEKYFFFANSKINIDLLMCSLESLELQFVNEKWDNFGPVLSYDLNEAEINLDRVYSCSQIKQDGFFNIRMDGEEKLFSITEAKWIDGRTRIKVYDYLNIDSELELFISGKEARVYDDSELNIYLYKFEVGGKKYDMNCRKSSTGCGFESFEIEEYGNLRNSWIKGKFKGRFWMKSYDPLKANYKNIEVEFLVPRNFN